MARIPAHAGRLSWWERVTFAGVFVLMAVVVATVAVTAGRPPGRAAAGGSAAVPLSPAETPSAGRLITAPRPGAPEAAGSAAFNQQLQQALVPLAARDGRFAVGVIDSTSGARAVYGGLTRFPATGVIRVGILAALLLRHQHPAAPLGRAARGLAARMIERGDARATARLWRQIGGSRGLRAADRRLWLRQTRPGPGGRWRLSTTTVTDQLRLMSDLTSGRSPLTSGSRRLALGLLQQARSPGAWNAAARPAGGGAPWAAANGGRRTRHGWAFGSVGVVRRSGHLMELAVLSDRQPSRRAGLELAAAAETRAAAAIGPPVTAARNHQSAHPAAGRPRARRRPRPGRAPTGYGRAPTRPARPRRPRHRGSSAPGPQRRFAVLAAAGPPDQAGTTKVFMILSARVCRLASHSGNSQPM